MASTSVSALAILSTTGISAAPAIGRNTKNNSQFALI
jgi:hypothetical protein